ncbi:GNAT family N-acetyltransferase [Flavobacteriaceae bacterium]|nr:GNAT family N-acetyltransferase [Flavobacteriaceae bacterium]
MKIFLRNLQDSDIDILLKIENDKSIWSYSIQDKPFSKSTIKNYVENAKLQDITEVNQKRFVVSSIKINVLGFIDLFDYDITKREASIGIVILKKYRNMGVGFDSVQLLESYCVNKLGMYKLYVSIDSNNIKSIKLFNKSGFVKRNNDLYEKILNE